MIQLDFSNMMEGVLGHAGISEKQISELQALASKAHEDIKKRLYPGLAFIDLPSQDTGRIKEIAWQIRNNNEDFVILGIGGSALGPRAILEALSPFHNLRKKPGVFICDNADPYTLKHILSIINIDKTVVNVITKSGSTAETMASFMVLWNELSERIGDRITKNVIATTDPEKGNLRKIAIASGLKTLPIHQDIGGRYSVLSPVGLLLSEVIGADSSKILKGAKDMHSICSGQDVWKNPAYIFGALLYLMNIDKKRNINILIPYADRLKSLSEWFCQLWAESLGKDGIGITPYPSLGTVDQHSQLQLWMEGPEDKVVIFIKVMDYGMDIKIPDMFKDIEGISYLAGHTLSELIKAEEESTELALAKNKRPNMTISLPLIDEYHLGQLFHFFEMATAFTGLLYGINPFNQPGVEESKNFTYGMLGKKGFEQKRQEVESARGKKTCYKL